MGDRPTISTRLRFEVFKRDSFTCTYCGRKAPDVILHVDHVEPVSAGGPTALLNLVTSCVDCNLGKGARQLADDSIVHAQRNQVEALQERHAQLAMLAAWQRGLAQLDETGAEEASDFWSDLTGYGLTPTGLGTLRRLIRRYGLGEVMEAMRVATEQYVETDDQARATDPSVETAWGRVGGICRVSQEEAADPGIKELYYIRGILRNRFGLTHQMPEALSILRRGRAAGVSAEEQAVWAKEASSWSRWRSQELEAVEAAEHGSEQRMSDSLRAPPSAATSAPGDTVHQPDARAGPDVDAEAAYWEEEEEPLRQADEEVAERAEIARDFWASGGTIEPVVAPRPTPVSGLVQDAPWVCGACGQWIPASGAVIELVHRHEDGTLGGYPRGDGGTSSSANQIAGLLGRSDVAICAFHPECQSVEHQGYGWSTFDSPTLESWVCWVVHVGQKTWMSRGDVTQLLRFWWTGRRLAVPDLHT